MEIPGGGVQGLFSFLYPVPAGSGVPGRQRQVYHGSTMAGGESGAAQRSGEEETEPEVCRALAHGH